MKKVPVEVESEVRLDEQIIPKAVIWSDGRRYPVAKVLYCGTSAVGEYEGIRYTVIIGNAEKYLYRIRQKWYVERTERRVK